jgi:predicted Ser/Thr protein kinase
MTAAGEYLIQNPGSVIVSCYMPDPAPGPMDAHEWARVREILYRALELDTALRPACLDAECGDDARLRAEVETLLAAAGNPASFDSPAVTSTITGTLPAGRRVAHYQVLGKIGEGGMGAVYHALDTRLERPVALKVLAHAGNPTGERRFVREAKAASALNHPNIVTIYEFDSDEGLDFIAMEYVQGRTLKHLLDQRSVPVSTLLDYARQAAAAVARAHEAGIVHRDLKPGNIMVTYEGIVKVLDFGMAKRQPSTASGAESTETTLTVAGTVVGTPAYMSPEQAMGETGDWRSDIFSFGVILYEIACGERPFQGRNAHAMMYRITQEEPRPPALINPSISPELSALILKCLKKERDQRVQSMEEVATALAGLAYAPAAPPRRISRRIMAVGGAAGAAAIAAALWWQRPAERTLRYWIEAQRMRDGVEAGAPYLASATDTFEGGWKFRLHVRPEQSGVLYVVNEGPADAGSTRLWVLQPPEGASPRVEARRELVTRWFVFDSNPGTEKLWIVWSQEALPAIGQAGEVRDPAQSANIRDLLANLKGAVRPAGPGPADGVQLRAAEGVMGSLIELRHQ